MRKVLVDIQARIADLKDKKSKAESNKSNAKDGAEKRKYEDEIKQLEADLYRANNDETAAKQALENRKKQVETAMYNIDQCKTYRKAVLYVFASVLDKMRNENESPGDQGRRAVAGPQVRDVEVRAPAADHNSR